MRKRWKEPTINSPTKKRPYFWFRITDSAGRKPVYTFRSYNEARRKLGELHNKLFDPIHNDSVSEIEIEVAIDCFLKQKKDIKGVVRYYDYKRNVMMFVNEQKLRYIEDLKGRLRDYFDWRKENGISGKGGAHKTINEERRFLSQVWECNIKNRNIPEYDLFTRSRNNPVLAIAPLPRKPKRQSRVIPKDELIKISQQAIEESKRDGIDWHGIYITLYSCGCRRDEVRTMKPEYIDLDNNIIRFPYTKTGVPKCIFIHPRIKPILARAKGRAIQNKAKVAFPNTKGEMLHKNAMRYKLIEICKKIGIQKCTVHDLRHTFASEIALSQETRLKQGAWKSEQTFQNTYNNPPGEVIRREYNSWDLNFLPMPDDLDKDTEKTQG